jgi:sterol desaturase/sphingolipid hydroxylase (fatty acid hydroxylase superfamily)
MLITALVQGLATTLGMVVGWLAPRQPEARVPGRATLLNVLNGGALFGLKTLVTACLPILSTDAIAGWVRLDTLGHPLLQFVVAFVALDLARWALHYAHHRVEWLWTFHRVHHCAETIDATTGLRMHVVDFLQLAALPVLLFGVFFETAGSPAWMLPAVMSVGIVADAIAHANMRFPLDRPWQRAWFALFMTPLFHAWHHTRDGHVRDGNYGNALPVWDRLFGTAVSGPLPPPLYGIRAEKTLEESLIGWWLLRPRRAPPEAPGA